MSFPLKIVLGDRLYAGAFISVHSWANHSAGGVKHCAVASARNNIAVCLLRSFKSAEVGAHACMFCALLLCEACWNTDAFKT